MEMELERMRVNSSGIVHHPSRRQMTAAMI